MKTVKLTPKASQDMEDMEDIWYYSCRQFGEEQADRYINQISGIFQVQSENNICPPGQNWVNISAHYPLNGI